MSAVLLQSEGIWRFTGELTLATVTNLLVEFTKQSQRSQVVDLREVTRTDSAGVALLIELLRQTQDNPMIFRNIPSQMLSIAAVCGVQDLLLTQEELLSLPQGHSNPL